MTRLAPLVFAGHLICTLAFAQSAPLVDYHQHLFGPKAITARDVIAMLDEAGIQRAVLLSTAYMHAKPERWSDTEQAKVREVNDWTAAQAAEYPGRLVAFCSVNPLKPYALEELERCAEDPNLRRGLKLHFANSDVQLENPEHFARISEIFRTANANGMAILVHLHANMSKNRPYGSAQATIFLEQLLPVAPDVPVVIAHLAGAGGWGAPAYDEAVEVLASAIERDDPRVRHLWLDVASVVTSDTTSAQAQSIAGYIRRIGPDRILYGTDAAVGTGLRPREAWAAFHTLPLSEAEFQTIASNLTTFMP